MHSIRWRHLYLLVYNELTMFLTPDPSFEKTKPVAQRETSQRQEQAKSLCTGVKGPLLHHSEKNPQGCDPSSIQKVYLSHTEI